MGLYYSISGTRVNVYKNCKHGSHIYNHGFIFLGAQKNRLIDTALLSMILFLYFKDISFTVVSFIMMKEVCCCLVVTADVWTDFIVAFQI